jgi:hypothetical protein
MRSRCKLLTFLAVIFMQITTLSCSQNKLIYLHFFGLSDNEVFNLNGPWNRDNCVKPFHDLREELNKIGYTIKAIKNISDIKEDFEYVVAFNILPSFIRIAKRYPSSKLAAFLWEPPIKSYSLNFDSKLHSSFSKIFTWDDNLVDNKFFLKLYYPQPSLEMISDVVPFEKRKFCTLINRNQLSHHPLELTTERLNTILFFEDKPGKFDFYGTGWDAARYKNYKGTVQKKTDCLKNYKFCICYENTRDTDGYISEKIFDCFVSGCIPVYWGSRNIEQYIPKNCYIKREDFNSINELYCYLESLSEEVFNEYIKNIKLFLESDRAYLFSIDNFIKIFINGLGLKFGV